MNTDALRVALVDAFKAIGHPPVSVLPTTDPRGFIRVVFLDRTAFTFPYQAAMVRPIAAAELIAHHWLRDFGLSNS